MVCQVAELENLGLTRQLLAADFGRRACQSLWAAARGAASVLRVKYDCQSWVNALVLQREWLKQCMIWDVGLAH